MKRIKSRNIILIFGVITMLFAGIIYAWSILKAPLGEELGYLPTELALNYTLTMCAFCLGGLGGSMLSRRVGVRAAIILGGMLAGLGICLTGCLGGGSALLLYLCYALMGGGGIGIIYNVIISSVSSHFPDKKGFCSGCLMMGFGLSALLLGNLAGNLFDAAQVGWRATYVIVGITLALVMLAASFVIYRAEDTAQESNTQESCGKDYSPKEMLAHPSFRMAFIALVCLTAVGSSVISFAKDLALAVGAEAAVATTLVGVLSVCNGLGRIITGRAFDLLGRRKTMLAASVVTLLAAAITLLAVYTESLGLCIVGLCLTGISYGSSPTVSSALVSEFYGRKHFATNFSIMNFNLIGAAFAALLRFVCHFASGVILWSGYAEWFFTDVMNNSFGASVL